MERRARKEDDGDQPGHDFKRGISGPPSRPFFSNVAGSLLRFLKPIAPQLIPLTVFVLTVPIVVFFSLSAGWFVWRSIAVGWETTVHLQYGDGSPPHAWSTLPSLGAHQPYDISVHLVVPASQANFELGNFMISLTLLTPSNRTIVSVRRPTIVAPPNPSPLSFLRWSPNQIRLEVPMLYSFEAGLSGVVAHTELGRKDQWKSLGTGEGRELSVLSAVLRGVVVHKGFRGLITRFPLFTATVSSGVFLFVSFIVLASCILPAIEWRLYPDRDGSDTESMARPHKRLGTANGSRASAKPHIRKRSHSATTRRQATNSEVKTEEEAATISSPPFPSVPLRRRRSRVSQSDSEN